MLKYKTITISEKHYRMIKRIAETEGRSVKNATEVMIERRSLY